MENKVNKAPPEGQEMCIWRHRRTILEISDVQITQDWIKARNEQVEVVTQMTLPMTIKEVQRLNGRVVALSEFLSRSADKCHPFF